MGGWHGGLLWLEWQLPHGLVRQVAQLPTRRRCCSPPLLTVASKRPSVRFCLCCTPEFGQWAVARVAEAEQAGATQCAPIAVVGTIPTDGLWSLAGCSENRA
jgi:hypothetical protein